MKFLVEGGVAILIVHVGYIILMDNDEVEMGMLQKGITSEFVIKILFMKIFLWYL